KLSVEDNIVEILETRKDLNKLQIEENLNELLDEFSIKHIRKSLGMSLSGGERIRVEISRALAMDRKFILLVEPCGGVEPG
ncbi:ATP-binding cassette domain-containing protein, partial [Francisella tularensis subsp. holarctica]|uniref:ATP-binding cassette domain-containing protein n=1 Tax=Francisella tularensis TaxID=263 RepID=UPI002381B009